MPISPPMENDVHGLLEGARTYALRREDDVAKIAALVAASVPFALLSCLGWLEAYVPADIVPLIALALVVSAVATGTIVHRHVAEARSGLRLHVSGTRRALERIEPPKLHDLSRTLLRAGRYGWWQRGVFMTRPVVVIALPTGPLVLSGPRNHGWKVSAPARSDPAYAPHALLADAAAFDALVLSAASA